jgi:hypothetical protein
MITRSRITISASPQAIRSRPKKKKRPGKVEAELYGENHENRRTCLGSPKTP